MICGSNLSRAYIALIRFFGWHDCQQVLKRGGSVMPLQQQGRSSQPNYRVQVRSCCRLSCPLTLFVRPSVPRRILAICRLASERTPRNTWLFCLSQLFLSLDRIAPKRSQIQTFEPKLLLRGVEKEAQTQSGLRKIPKSKLYRRRPQTRSFQQQRRAIGILGDP